jgi:Uma2 family endonuclease
MSTHQASMTAEDLLALDDVGRCELIQGELIRMSPNNPTHGFFVSRLDHLLRQHVMSNNLGVVLAGEPGFTIASDPDTVRASDAAFLAARKFDELPRRGFFEGAPDLAVEVVSPDDRWSELNAKAKAWLDAGSRAVWVVDPENRTVTEYRSGTAVQMLREQDMLEGGDVIPGFRIHVGDIFAGT